MPLAIHAEPEADLTYADDGLFTNFMPNTKVGEGVWKEIAKEDGTGKVLSIHAKSVIAQIRAAGYTVRKRKPAKIDTVELDAILAELND